MWCGELVFLVGLLTFFVGGVRLTMVACSRSYFQTLKDERPGASFEAAPGRSDAK
jgi:hypothetical protein